jgi:nucleoside-diphosphate-sugar epimerase
VVNCVGGSPATIVTSARCLFRAAIPTGPVVVQMSSMAVYGAAQGEVDEQAPLRGDCGAYGAAKVEAERLAADYRRAVILRPGCVYGPGGPQWGERLARLLRAHRIGDLGAGGDGFANMVHVEDVAAAALAALRRPDGYGHAYNLALPNPPTWNDFFLQFARALGAVPIARLSERRLALETRLLAPPLKVAEMVARRLGLGAFPPPAIPPSLARLWRQEIRLLVGKAENHLDMRWTSLDRGLAETARSLQTHAG